MYTDTQQLAASLSRLNTEALTLLGEISRAQALATEATEQMRAALRRMDESTEGVAQLQRNLAAVIDQINDLSRATNAL